MALQSPPKTPTLSGAKTESKNDIRIEPIPAITPFSPSPTVDFSSTTPPLAAHGIRIPPRLSQLPPGLLGKKIDEYGHILADDGVEVLGKAAGDLPAIVGQHVEEDGVIRDDSGAVAGYVVEEEAAPEAKKEARPARPLSSNLRVDDMGNILDGDEIVGTMRKPESRGHNRGGASSDHSTTRRGNEEGPRIQQATPLQPQINNTISPSEVMLDVKSTMDGLQLTIRIPAVIGTPSLAGLAALNGTDLMNLGNLQQRQHRCHCRHGEDGKVDK